MTPEAILAAIDAAIRLIEFISKVRDQAVRTSEWTPAEEAAVDARLQAAFKSPAWQPKN